MSGPGEGFTAPLAEYRGKVRLCLLCHEPAYRSSIEYGRPWLHFREQHKTVFCPQYPLAVVSMNSVLFLEWYGEQPWLHGEGCGPAPKDW
jgi:hypothetical protein